MIITNVSVLKMLNMSRIGNTGKLIQMNNVHHLIMNSVIDISGSDALSTSQATVHIHCMSVFIPTNLLMGYFGSRKLEIGTCLIEESFLVID